MILSSFLLLLPLFFLFISHHCSAFDHFHIFFSLQTFTGAPVFYHNRRCATIHYISHCRFFANSHSRPVHTYSPPYPIFFPSLYPRIPLFFFLLACLFINHPAGRRPDLLSIAKPGSSNLSSPVGCCSHPDEDVNKCVKKTKLARCVRRQYFSVFFSLSYFLYVLYTVTP
jgi:hypothetical protein